MKAVGTLVLWLIAIFLVAIGVFAYVIAAYVAVFNLHLGATLTLKLEFAGLFLLQMMSLAGGLYLMAGCQ
jgi:hypothetical protein